MSKIPLVYPKIPALSERLLSQCIAFEKYDGTNLHWVWERELGWYAFGTRRDRFDLDARGIAEFEKAHPGLEGASGVFGRMLAAPLAERFRRGVYDLSEEITVFTEFLGASSFAGLHRAGEEKQLVLFDVLTEGGFVPPAQFVEDFGDCSAARVLYRGRLTGRFVQDIREGRYAVAEGVICKGMDRTGEVWRVKIKTNAYMERLRQVFSQNWVDYWE